MEATPDTEAVALEVRSNYNRNMVCVFKRGPRLVWFLGVEGPQLTVCQQEAEKFEREYYRTPTRRVAGEDIEYTGMDFALAYMRNAEARKMVPISPAAIRVLTAIIRGQQAQMGETATPNHELEIAMAQAKDDGFRKPEGPVARVHKFLDGKLDQIKRGTVSRKELIEQMTSKGIAEGTAVTQAGVWARNNGVSFARPQAAAEAKSAARAKPKAAAKKAPAKGSKKKTSGKPMA